MKKLQKNILYCHGISKMDELKNPTVTIKQKLSNLYLRIECLMEKHPKAKIIAHPACEKPVLIIADHIGSTSSLLKYTISDESMEYIVATESGIIHQMQKSNPDKLFIPAPPKDSTCACNDCKFMKLITLKKIYNTSK